MPWIWATQEVLDAANNSSHFKVIGLDGCCRKAEIFLLFFFFLHCFCWLFHLAKTFENVCATKQKSHFPFLYHFNGFIMAKFSTRWSGLFKFLAECPWGSLMPLKQWLLSPVAESECLLRDPHFHNTKSQKKSSYFSMITHPYPAGV